jgi:hypothetical protein
VEGLALSETEKETAHRVRAGDVQAQATLSSLPAPNKKRIFIVCILLCVMTWKRRMIVAHLDRLAPYEGTARVGTSSRSSLTVIAMRSEPWGGR